MGILKNRGAFLFILLFSCSELEEAAVDLGLDYQPLKVGNFWEYQVEETFYFGESDAETHIFFYRDKITSNYTNNSGEQVFAIQRQKSSDQHNWQQEKTFSYRLSNGTLIRTMDNQTTIPMVFPPGNGMEWDSNVYNTLAEDIYVMNMPNKYSIGDVEYTSAVKVVQSEEDDLITLRDHRYEVFVKGVGLVESYFEVLTYCSRNDCLGEQIIDSGRFTHLKLITNG
ncbi:MAG: hypothetical protein WD426_08420 [Anditalea sp.]